MKGKEELHVLNHIKNLIKSTENIFNDIAVIIVANSKTNQDKFTKYSKHSLTTEFYAEREYEEIISGFRSNGVYVEFYTSEMAFIEWVIKGGLNKIDKKFKVVYNAANSGKGPGKKSLIPAFCNLNNISLTNSDPYVVSLCRHKYHCATLLAYNGIPTPLTWCYHKDAGWLSAEKPPLRKIIIAKPTYESASVGIDENSVFEYQPSSENTLKKISEEFDQPITVQEFIPGYEVEVPVVIHNRKPMTIHPVGLTLNNNELLGEQILDYDVVYNDGYGFYSFNHFGEKLNLELMNYAQKAVGIIGTEGFGRIDFRITKEGRPFIMDVATYPHVIKHSSFWFLFQSYGFEYKDIFALLLSLSAEKYQWK